MSALQTALMERSHSGLVEDYIQLMDKAQSRKFLIDEFLDCMNEIGEYGHAKYGEKSFQFRRSMGDTSRGKMERNEKLSIGSHIRSHLAAYVHGVPHDHFKTRKHQLAAIAYNAMMEFYFAQNDRPQERTE